MPSRPPKTTAPDIDLLGNDTDPDGDRLVVEVVEPGQLGTVGCSWTACRYLPRPDANGSETLTYTVVDTFGGVATATVRIQIAPVEDALSVGRLREFRARRAPIPVPVSVFDPDGPAFAIAGSPVPLDRRRPARSPTRFPPRRP